MCPLTSPMSQRDPAFDWLKGTQWNWNNWRSVKARPSSPPLPRTKAFAVNPFRLAWETRSEKRLALAFRRVCPNAHHAPVSRSWQLNHDGSFWAPSPECENRNGECEIIVKKVYPRPSLLRLTLTRHNLLGSGLPLGCVRWLHLD